MRARILLAAAATAWVAGLMVVVAQRRDAFVESREHASIKYNTGPVDDAITDLNRKLDAGTVRFNFDPVSGYLRSALEALNVPVESQALVFTPTSMQAPKINPQNPRAVYFADTVSVAWVRGGTVLEAWAQDPRQGTQFYTMDQQASGAPRFGRQLGCVSCHLTWETVGVPGPFVLTTYPRKTDRDYANGSTVDHRTPIAERWGGWYVTGRSGPATHMGNLPLFMPKPAPSSEPLQSTVEGRFDLSGYPSAHSDIVSLMVLEHQTRMTNLITRVGWEARVGDVTRVRDAAGDLVDYMLFVDEAPITTPITGTSGFTEKFSAMGPRDGKGRSLRELQLESRLMKYPLSYMIYSPSFDALPAMARHEVLRRLNEVLSGRDARPQFAHLTPAMRQALIEILRDTKPGLFDEPTP